MDNNSTQKSSTQRKISLNKSSSIPNHRPPKQIFVTLQKSGNAFTFVKPPTSGLSKIPKPSTTILTTSRLTNAVAPVNQATFNNAKQVTSIPSSQYKNHSDDNTKLARQNNGTNYQNQYQSQNESGKVIPTIGIINKSALNKLTYNRKPSVAASSITISKQKPAKRTCKKKEPNQVSTSKFIFPIPPPKIDFKVSTITQFKTAIDEPREHERQIPSRSCNSSSLEGDVAPVSTDVEEASISLCGDTKGVPNNCPAFNKLRINTSKNQFSIQPSTNNPSIQDSSKTVRRISGLELREAIENVDLFCPSQTTSDPVAEFIEPLTEPVGDHGGFRDIIQRLDRVEALQLAAAKRDAQILVAVKKLCLAYTKHNDDNDEIKKLLPMKTQIEFNAMEIRLTEEPAFLEKLRAFLRGFKISNNIENFSSMLSVLMIDELVDDFNLKGILNKERLQGYKVIDIIQDLHKPMDIKTFEKRMRTTIDLAKNRYHNDKYRKRQLQIKQQLDVHSGHEH